MSLLKLYLKSYSISKRSKGFTLIELLVAIAMASIVMLALGGGMVALLRSTRNNAAKTDLKNQLNRALDYINEDLKNARVAGIDNSQDLNGDGTNDEALVITYFPGLSDSTPRTIRYFLAASTDSDPWLGPKLLMRLEDSEGDGYNDNAAQVLVDGIADIIETDELPDGAGFCPGPTQPPLRSTTLANGGFQACVESATTSNNSPLFRTTIVLASEVNNARVSVNTDTIARSITPSLDALKLSFTPETDLTPELTWDVVLGAEFYNIYECITTDPTCTPTETDLLAGNLPAGTTSLPDNTEPSPAGSATPSRACYSGLAFNGTVSSPPSTPVCTIISPSAVPSAVTSADLLVSNDIQPTVTWSRKDDAITYKLYRCETPNPAVPCTIDPATDTPIDTFTATNQAQFDVYVPWFEANNTDAMPSDNTAFCYGVVSANVRGDSNISDSIKCGKLNQSLTLTNWNVQFTNSFFTGTTPQGIAWNSIASATQYRLSRCTTSSTTCTPETQSTAEIIVNAPTTSFNESATKPAPGNRFCYQVRAESATQRSPYSTVKCGDREPALCTLDMQALGLGAIINRKSTVDSTARQTLINVVTGANFENLTFEKLANPTGFSPYSANQLYQVFVNGSDGRDGNNTRTLACNTPILFRWHYSDNFVYPPSVSINTTTSTTPDQPIFTWGATADANRYDIYRCQTPVNVATCNPSSSGILVTRTGAGSYNTAQRPSNNTRYCYGVIAVNTSLTPNVSSSMSQVLCGGQR